MVDAPIPSQRDVWLAQLEILGNYRSKHPSIAAEMDFLANHTDMSNSCRTVRRSSSVRGLDAARPTRARLEARKNSRSSQLLPDRLAGAWQAVVGPARGDGGDDVVAHADLDAPISGSLGRHLVGGIDTELGAQAGLG